MMLVRDRRVALDARAAAYVPLAPYATDYTVRQLLQQTTRAGELHRASPPFSPASRIRDDHAGRAAGLIARAPLAFTPGSQFAYSNTNYIVLGMIVEAAARMPYGRFIAERIATPLGLAHLSSGRRTARANLTRGYEPASGEPRSRRGRPKQPMLPARCTHRPPTSCAGTRRSSAASCSTRQP